MTDRLRWDDELTKVRSGKSILRSPLRLGLAIGAGITAVGALLPWAEGMVGLLPKRHGGFEGAYDGLTMATLAVILFVIARIPGFFTAVDGGRRWAPMLIALACLALWILGRQSSEMAIRAWEDDDGNGAITFGYWVTGLGVAVIVILGSYATLRHREGQTSDPTALLRLPRRGDVVPLAMTVGGLAGMVGGAALALSIFPPTTVSAPLLFLVGIGLVVGIYAGRAIGRGVHRLLS